MLYTIFYQSQLNYVSSTLSLLEKNLYSKQNMLKFVIVKAKAIKSLSCFPSTKVTQIILSSHLAKSFDDRKLKKESQPMLRSLQTPWSNMISLSIPHWDNNCLLLQGITVSAVKVVVQILVRAQDGGLSKKHTKICFCFLLYSKIRWQKSNI